MLSNRSYRRYGQLCVFLSGGDVSAPRDEAVPVVIALLPPDLILQPTVQFNHDDQEHKLHWKPGERDWRERLRQGTYLLHLRKGKWP